MPSFGVDGYRLKIGSAVLVGRPASVMAMSGMDNAQFGCPLRTTYSACPQGTTAGPEPGVVAVRVIGLALKEAALIVLCRLQASRYTQL